MLSTHRKWNHAIMLTWHVHTYPVIVVITRRKFDKKLLKLLTSCTNGFQINRCHFPMKHPSLKIIRCLESTYPAVWKAHIYNGEFSKLLSLLSNYAASHNHVSRMSFNDPCVNSFLKIRMFFCVLAFYLCNIEGNRLGKLDGVLDPAANWRLRNIEVAGGGQSAQTICNIPSKDLACFAGIVDLTSGEFGVNWWSHLIDHGLVFLSFFFFSVCFKHSIFIPGSVDINRWFCFIWFWRVFRLWFSTHRLNGLFFLASGTLEKTLDCQCSSFVLGFG